MFLTSSTDFETYFSDGANITSYNNFKPFSKYRLQSKTKETQKNQSRGTDLIKY